MSVPRPARRCSHPACTHTAQPGTSRCEQHHEASWARSHLTPQQKARRYGTRYQQQRRRVLDRDQYQCVACGAPAPLEVHHLRDADHVDDHELVTLCRSCHRAVERGQANVVEQLQRQGWGV